MRIHDGPSSAQATEPPRDSEGAAAQPIKAAKAVRPRSSTLLTFEQASEIAQLIAAEFETPITIQRAGRDWIPTAIANCGAGGIELFIPSRVRLDSLAFEATLYVPTLPPKYQHWRRTASGYRRQELTILNQCRKRALQIARAFLASRGAA